MMAYTLIKKLVPSSKYPIKCPYAMTPTRIVVHNTANDASARNEIAYMTNNNNTVSFHYAVDDKEVVQGILESRNAWHAGDGSNGTGNRYGIGIEICYSKSGGARFNAAERNAAAFIATRLKKYRWGIKKVTKHQDYNGKFCPHRTLDRGWQKFLELVTVELAKLNPPVPPPVVPTPTPAITYKPLVKTVILSKDTNLWDFNFTDWANAKPVASFPKDQLVEVVAIATNKLDAEYYMTAYSYNGGNIRNTHGFNIADCNEYTPPPIVVEPETPVPPLVEPEEPTEPPVTPEPPTEPPVTPDPPVEPPVITPPADSLWSRIIKWFLSVFTNKGKE